MENPNNMGLFDLARAAYQKRSGLTDAYNKQMAANIMAPTVESYIQGQKASMPTQDQIQRYQDQEFKKNLSPKMYKKWVNNEPLDQKSTQFKDKFYDARNSFDNPARTPEGYNVSLPKADFVDRARLMSAFQENAPNLDPTNTKLVQGLLGNQTRKPTTLMQNITAAGLDLNTKEGQDFMRKKLMQAQTQINMGKTGDAVIPIPELMKMRSPNGERPPIGTTYGQAGSLGLTLEGNVSGDTASKLAMLDTAKQGIQDIQAIQFDANGNINTDAIKEAWGIGVAEPLAGLMNPESGKLFSAYEFGIQAITRAETGAAMPAEEVNNTRKRFMPKPWDSDQVVRQKWKAYQLFINNASKYVNPAAAKSGDWKNTIDFTKLMSDAKSTEKTVKFEDM